jgi:hypothetical protein
MKAQALLKTSSYFRKAKDVKTENITVARSNIYSLKLTYTLLNDASANTEFVSAENGGNMVRSCGFERFYPGIVKKHKNFQLV